MICGDTNNRIDELECIIFPKCDLNPYPIFRRFIYLSGE